jgi:hypothetical protein
VGKIGFCGTAQHILATPGFQLINRALREPFTAARNIFTAGSQRVSINGALKLSAGIQPELCIVGLITPGQQKT